MTTKTNVAELMDSEPYYSRSSGAAYHGDSRELLEELPDESIDLVVTSPPFALQKKRKYGDRDFNSYKQWFVQGFAEPVKRVLKPHGSFVIDIGGGWQRGKPVRSTYHFELLTDLAGTNGPFHLAQDFYWYNPAKLPTPAQWVTIEGIRVTDAINHVWWLSKTERPESDNSRVLQEYSDSQRKLMEKDDGERLSEHDINSRFDAAKEDGTIPSNLIEAANTASNTHYRKACKKVNVDPHPARFPRDIPEFFIQFLTPDPPYDEDEEIPIILDIFAGSNMTGKIAKKHGRNWLAFERTEEYLQTSELRFTEMEEIEEKVDERQSGLEDFGENDDD